MGKRERLARELLHELRTEVWGSKLEVVGRCIGIIRCEAAKGIFTLESIGTSEEELEKFLKNCFKVRAEEELKRIREGKGFLAVLRFCLAEGRLTPADISTSEEELKKLANRNSV